MRHLIIDQKELNKNFQWGIRKCVMKRYLIRTMISGCGSFPSSDIKEENIKCSMVVFTEFKDLKSKSCMSNYEFTLQKSGRLLWSQLMVIKIKLKL